MKSYSSNDQKAPELPLSQEQNEEQINNAAAQQLDTRAHARRLAGTPTTPKRTVGITPLAQRVRLRPPSDPRGPGSGQMVSLFFVCSRLASLTQQQQRLGMEM